MSRVGYSIFAALLMCAGGNPLELHAQSATPPAALGPKTAADSLSLWIAIYGVAFTNGTGTAHGAALPEVICVDGFKYNSDPPAAIIDSLQFNRTTIVRPSSQCRRADVPGRTTSTSLMQDTVTGKRGIVISATDLKFTSDSTFTFGTQYWQHMLSSAGYFCEGRRADGRWQITHCKLGWIS